MRVFSLLALLFGLSLCSPAWMQQKSMFLAEERDTNLYQLLESKPEVSKFLDMINKNVNASSIIGILTGTNKLFLLAPSNTALDGVADLTTEEILYHIVKAGAISVPSDGECMATELRFVNPTLVSVVCFNLANETNPQSQMLVNGVAFAPGVLASNGELFVLVKALSTPPPVVNATIKAGGEIGALILGNGKAAWQGQALTYIAPTDAALKQKLPAAWAGFMQQATGNGPAFASIFVGANSGYLLAYEGEDPFNDGGGVLELADGGSANVTGSLSSGFEINGNAVLQMDLLGKDGVAHLLDGVLSVPFTEKNFSLEDVLTGLGVSKTLAFLNSTDLLKALGNTSRSFTVFAPSDEAWARVAKLPTTKSAKTHVMMYHVVTEDIPQPVEKKKFPCYNSHFQLYFKDDNTIAVSGVNNAYDKASILALYGPGAPAQAGINGHVYVIDQVLTQPDSGKSKHKPTGLEVKWIVLIVICGVVVLLVAVAAVGGAAYWFYKNRYLPRQANGYAEVLDDNEAYSETFE